MNIFDKKRLVFLEDKGKFLKITMNYYEKRNTFSNEFGRAFTEVLKKVSKGKQNVVVITGVKDCFCAGANLNTITSGSSFDIHAYLSRVADELNNIEKSPKIFISAVNGHCVGGGLELAMATDYMIASKDTKFGLPEIKLGLIPGADGIKRLVRSVGKRKATDLIITGRVISAKEALGSGIINEVVSRRKLMGRAEEIANEIASKNPTAVQAIKRLADRATQYNITNEEIGAFQRCLKTDHAKNAIAAFLNKKK